MPHYLNVYNTTLEPFHTQFKSQGFRFKARSLTKVPEEFEFALPQYSKHGLVVINPGDNLQAKEKEGLLNYLGFLMERRAYINMWLDEKKRGGVTVDKPDILKNIEQWITEIKERYALDPAFEPAASFKDQTPLDAKDLFGGEMQVQEVEEIVRKAPKKASSFKEVNIEEEIKS